MNKQTASLMVAALVILLTALADNIYGCTCQGVSPCEVYGRANAVFVGKLIGGTEKNTERELNGELIELEGGDVRFEVEETFKGVSGKEITIFIDIRDNSSCALSGFRPGERYLVFASEFKGKLGVGFCNPPRRLSTVPTAEIRDKEFYRKNRDFSAEMGLAFLRSLPADKSLGRLSVVVEIGDEAISGIPIIIQDSEKTKYEEVTDVDGESVFENLKPGKYSVTANWPKDYVGSFHRSEIEVTAQSCIEVQALAAYSGLIIGRVSDEHNQPAQSIRVYALPTKPKEDSSNPWGETDKDGRFEIGGLAAGNYRLYIESASKGTPNYYYPGFSDPKQAIEIVIGKGDISEGLEFKLPPTVETQTIKGKVIWPDGKPVVGATIYLGCPERLIPSDSQIKLPTPYTNTDADGNFSIQGLKGFSYWLKGSKHTGDPNTYRNKDYVHTPLRRLTLADEVIEVRLTLSEAGNGPRCEDEKKLKNQN